MKYFTHPLSISFLILMTGFLTLACQPNPQNHANEVIPPIVQANFLTPLDENAPLSLTSGLDNATYIYDGTAKEGYYYVEVKANALPPRKVKRTPLNLSIVIDKSGSMQGEKMENAKRAAKYIIEQMNSEDYVSIVEYEAGVNVVSPSNKVTDKNLLYRRIDAMYPEGSTNLGDGMKEGYKQVKSTFKSGAINRVLLLSDGLANVGITDPAALQRIAKTQNLQESITLSTFGLGLGYNETLMTNLSEFGSGNYYFIPNPEAISAIFEKELNGLLNVVAQNATLSVQLPAGITVTNVFGYPFEQTGDQLIIQFRDIVAKETKAVTIKFVVNGNAPEYEFASSLSYIAASNRADNFTSISTKDILKRAENIEEFKESVSPTIKTQAILFESNEKLEEAMRQLDAGNYEIARTLTQQNADYLQSNSEFVRGSDELERQEINNSLYQSQISEVENMNDADRNYLQKSTRSTNYDMRKKR